MILSLLQSLQQIACLAPLVWGVWLAFSILRFPDLTFQGTFTLGAAVFAAVFAVSSGSPFFFFVALVGSFLSGASGGILTAVTNSKLKVPSLLSGIGVSLVLYSISLLIMDGPSLEVHSGSDLTGGGIQPLFNRMSINDKIFAIAASSALEAMFLFIIIIPLFLLLRLGLVSRIGLFVRASGSNPSACDSNGINSGVWLGVGLAVANGCAGLSGALFAYNLRFSDVSFGAGILALALGSVIMAEAFGDGLGWSARLVSLCASLAIFQAIRVSVLRSPIGSDYLRLVEGTFLIVLLAVSALLRHRRPLKDLRL